MEEGRNWIGWLTQNIEEETTSKEEYVYYFISNTLKACDLESGESLELTEVPEPFKGDYADAVERFESEVQEKKGEVFIDISSAHYGFGKAAEGYCELSEIVQRWPYDAELINHAVKCLEALSLAYQTLQGVLEIAIKEKGIDLEIYEEEKAERYGFFDIRFRLKKAIEDCRDETVVSQLETQLKNLGRRTAGNRIY